MAAAGQQGDRSLTSDVEADVVGAVHRRFDDPAALDVDGQLQWHGSAAGDQHRRDSVVGLVRTCPFSRDRVHPHWNLESVVTRTSILATVTSSAVAYGRHRWTTSQTRPCGGRDRPGTNPSGTSSGQLRRSRITGWSMTATWRPRSQGSATQRGCRSRPSYRLFSTKLGMPRGRPRRCHRTQDRRRGHSRCVQTWPSKLRSESPTPVLGSTGFVAGHDIHQPTDRVSVSGPGSQREPMEQGPRRSPRTSTI